ncbi:MAG: TIGR02391 family protein [Ignavibacteriae bacterium]|nr:TIGR02391 family protein [Ignavibacteriota bacterium]
MSGKNELVMRFDPNTIQHLGIKMYSTLPSALAELIANAYDADAHEVMINLYDKKDKKIIVSDNGFGMTFEEVNDHFLLIGRNKRTDGEETTPLGRKVTGKKGLGKLAFFGIGETIEVSTIKEDSGVKVSFVMDWNELINTRNHDYKPKFKIEDCNPEEKGTTITLTNLKRKTSFNIEDLAESISKLFNLLDSDFKVVLNHNDEGRIEVDNKLKYSHIDKEFEFDFPEFTDKVESDYEYKNEIKGKILTSEKPLKPGLRGITLYANGRLVNAPEFFGVSESSHGYSYFTGWLEVDYVDDWDEDVISTNRQSLNWDLPRTEELRIFLRKTLLQVERVWREERNKERRKKIQEKTDVDITKWYENLPKEILSKIEPSVELIVNNSELEEEQQEKVIKNLHDLAPEYPYYHWRHLHPKIQEVSEEHYQKEDYIGAAFEAVKMYVKEVQKKSTLEQDGQPLMMSAFGKDNCKLQITNNNTQSEKDIEEGQKFMSAGVVAGFRNPVSHETQKDIHPNVFNDKDCLDILSLLSYLLGKLDKAKLVDE